MEPKTFPRVDADLAVFDRALARLRAEFALVPADPEDKEWVKLKLRHMVDVDQYLRKESRLLVTGKYSEDETRYFWEKLGPQLYSINNGHKRDLKELLGRYGWFRIGEFGPDADLHAWLLVQHADDDLAFQKEVLQKLEALYPQGEADPSNYAYLFDRVASNENRPQRYGTQGQRVGQGKWEPDTLEDPARVDEWRASVGLEPLEEYKKRFADI